MSDASKQDDWTKPAAMAIPEGGFFKDKVEQGRYGPIFPKTPACYGFSVIAKVRPGWEDHLYKNAKIMEQAVANDPTVLNILKAHYLRWVIFEIKGEKYLMYQGIFDTDFDKYCEDASFLFGQTGIQATFEALEGWPASSIASVAAARSNMEDRLMRAGSPWRSRGTVCVRLVWTTHLSRRFPTSFGKEWRRALRSLATPAPTIPIAGSAGWPALTSMRS